MRTKVSVPISHMINRPKEVLEDMDDLFESREIFLKRLHGASKSKRKTLNSLINKCTYMLNNHRELFAEMYV